MLKLLRGKPSEQPQDCSLEVEQVRQRRMADAATVALKSMFPEVAGMSEHGGDRYIILKLLARVDELERRVAELSSASDQ